MPVTVPLFHGPGSHEAAKAHALAAGRIAVDVCPAEGSQGLGVDALRDVVSLLLSPPVGDGKAYVLAGPIDMAAGKASDALLKAIEEPRDGTHLAVLWANDIGSVSPTIVSRCQALWALGEDVSDPALQADARELLAYWLKGSFGQVPVVLDRWKENPSGILQGLALAISEKRDRRSLELWGRLRPLSRDVRGPTMIELAAVLSRGA